MTHDLPRIQAASFLTLHYRLAGPAGEVINTFGGKPATLSLGTGELSPEVERCLIGLEEGVHRTFDLAAGVAFGPRNPDMQQWVAAGLLRDMGDPQERYAPGDVVQFPTPDGQSSYAGAVVAVKGNASGQGAQAEGAVLFDFNHPLAGQPVSFEVKVIAVL
jgi:FKBP-type peptidyl-prolyl cis-trans isomerase SlpA